MQLKQPGILWKSKYIFKREYEIISLFFSRVELGFLKQETRRNPVFDSMAHTAGIRQACDVSVPYIYKLKCWGKTQLEFTKNLCF